MSEHTYKHIEITGSSTKSSDDAIRVAVAEASKNLTDLHWYQVTDQRGFIENGEIKHWQVTVKIGFRINR